MTDFIDAFNKQEDPTSSSEISLTRHSRRKPVRITSDIVTSVTNVEPLTIEQMTLKAVNTTTVHFKRLKYKGCPKLTKKGQLDPKTRHIDMERDDFVRQMYYLFKSGFNSTSASHFATLCQYIAWVDLKGSRASKEDYFQPLLVKAYMEQWDIWVKQGMYKKGTWSLARAMLSALLKAQGRHSEAKNLPSIKGIKKDTVSYEGIHVESELKPAAQALFRGFYGLAKHVKQGTVPKIHPLWDKELFQRHALTCKWNAEQKRSKEKAFRVAASINGTWRNQLVRVAAMLCFMFTGMNTSPLLRMRHSDVKFKQIQGGKYLFEAEKGRAQHLELDNALGFSKRAKEFIEDWLSLSALISEDDETEWLFPYFTRDGKVSNFVNVRKYPQTGLNKLLGYLGLTPLSASVLRQTKSDTLMKVTEDIYLVSMSMNNGVNTVKRHYSGGLTKDHERNLAASMDAKFNIAKQGKLVKEAVDEAKYAYHDVLSEYDYQRLRKNTKEQHEALTPVGVRCQDNTLGAAELIDKALKRSGIDTPEEEKRCTDFLECFECEHHKLVAAVDDIWLMLSFQDTLNEMQQYPTVNSSPKVRYKKLCMTIEAILSRFKEVDIDNYTQAQEKHKEACHPLYSSLYSLNDLLEVFSWR